MLNGKERSGILLPYLRERGSMGGALYIGSRLGDGPIFEVSVSQLDAKSSQVNYLWDLHNSNSSHGYH